MQSSERSGYMLGGGAVVIGLLLVAVYFLFGGYDSDYTERVTGKITSCYQTYWATDETSSDEYKIKAEYVVDGEVYEYTGVEHVRSYNEGDMLELAFIPGDPEHAVTAAGVDNAFVLPIIGGIIAAVGVLILIFRAKRKPAQD